LLVPPRAYTPFFSPAWVPPASDKDLLGCAETPLRSVRYGPLFILSPILFPQPLFSFCLPTLFLPPLGYLHAVVIGGPVGRSRSRTRRAALVAVKQKKVFAPNPTSKQQQQQKTPTTNTPCLLVGPFLRFVPCSEGL